MPPALVAVLMLSCSPHNDAQSSFGPSSLSADGSVLFADDFESGSLNLWPDGVNPALHRIATDPAGAQSGSRYLVATFPNGRDGGWLTTFFMPGYDSLHVSYYVRLPAGWKGAPKLVAFYGSRFDDQWSGLGKAGRCPGGEDFFSAMLITEQVGDPGPTRFYTYYPEMSREPDGRTCWGRYGNGSEQYSSLSPLQTDRWHHVEFEVHLNAPGAKNARQAFWIDGEQRGAWSGFSFGDTSVLRLNALQLTFSLTGGSPRTQELHVDNVVVRAAG